MTKGNRSWLMFGISSAGMAACAVMVGMTNHKAPAPDPVPELLRTFASKELAAKDTLKAELLRRFTDRQNVDFGMSRIVRPDQRRHFGPVMGKHEISSLYETRLLAGGNYEFQFDGEWFSMNERKPLMTPENDAEKQAIGILKSTRVDAAIYTVGQFELDRGENPANDPNQENQNPHHTDFSYGNYTSIRAKGPAYISQKSAIAPRAYELVEFGRKAWASGKAEFISEGKGGWTYFAHRVAAPDMSCASCHGDRKVQFDREPKQIRGAVQKVGDGVGLFVIALRRS